MPRTLRILCALGIGLALLTLAGAAFAQDATAPLSGGAGPGIRLEVGTGDGAADLVPALKIALLLLLLSLVPALLMSVTSFTRIVIVLGFVRHALGTQSLPPNPVIIGLSLFLCAFTMGPVISEIKAQAYDPYEAGTLTDGEAFGVAMGSLREFMAKHTREEELALFLSMTQETRPETFDEVSTWVLVPAFMLSELRTAFMMGALIFIPFVIIDLVIASVLMSMGMMMVPPVMIALPIKLLLFVVADGWNLVVGSVARSVMGG